MTYIHITAAGRAAGINAGALNDALERHARDFHDRTITLPDCEYRVLSNGVTPPAEPATATIQ